MEHKGLKNTSALRIIQAIGSKHAGGAEQFFLRLILALKKPEYARQINVLPVVRRGSWLANNLTAAGVVYHTLPFLGWWDIYTKVALWRLAKKYAAHGIMAWMNRGASALLPQKWVPWVQLARIGGYYNFKYYRRKITSLVVNTADLKTYALAQNWPAGQVDALPNFIPEPPLGWQKKRAEIRKNLGIANNAYVALMAGRLHPVKGVDVALQALARVPHMVLVLVGDGPEKSNLQAQSLALGVQARVRFVGWQSHISGYAAAADVWLAPSRHEPLGNVVLDAWAHTLPIIAARAVGPAALIHSGKNGLLVDVDDAEDLAAACKKLKHAPLLATQIAKAGRAHFSKHFAEDVVVKQFISYYQKTIKDTPL